MHLLPQVRSIVRGLMTLALLFASAATLTAQVPRELTYQGILRTTGGVLVNGLQNIRFNLYTAPLGGLPIWTEPHTGANAVNVTNGLFTTRLGVITPFPVSVDFANQYWLEIEYPLGTPLTPRTQLAAAPYAIHAALADAIPGAYQWTLSAGYLHPSSPFTQAPLAIGGTGAPPPGAGRLNVWGDPADPTIVKLDMAGAFPGNFTGITAGTIQAGGAAMGLDLPQIISTGSSATGIRAFANGSTSAAGIMTTAFSTGTASGVQASAHTTGPASSYGLTTHNLTPAGNPMPQYGVHANTLLASSGAAVYAQGAGTAGPGVPKAAALELANGAFNITGASQPAGSFAMGIPAGVVLCNATILNPYVTPNSRILVTVEDISGVPPGTQMQVFTAIVSAKVAGQFDVTVQSLTPPPPFQTCAGAPVAMTNNIQINYLIIGQ